MELFWFSFVFSFSRGSTYLKSGGELFFRRLDDDIQIRCLYLNETNFSYNSILFLFITFKTNKDFELFVEWLLWEQLRLARIMKWILSSNNL